MEQVDEASLDELRLGQRCGHAQDRLVGKEYCPFGHRVDVPAEAERPQIGDEAVGKLAQTVDRFEVFGGEGEGFEKLYSLLDPRRYQEAPA